MRHIIKSTLPAAAIAAALALGLSACGQGEASEPDPTVSTEASAAALRLGDAWVKAADDGMTGVFGTLENTTDEDINLVGATFEGASMVELHETVDDGSGSTTMREKEGGFVIPAGGTFALEPGGNHIMVMGLTKPIKAGEEIAVELITADQQTFPVTAIAKDYSGAQETYAPDEAESGSDSGTDSDGQQSAGQDSGTPGSESGEHEDMGDHSGMDMSGSDE